MDRSCDGSVAWLCATACASLKINVLIFMLLCNACWVACGRPVKDDPGMVCDVLPNASLASTL